MKTITRNELYVLIIGTIILAPIFISLCGDTITSFAFSIVYGTLVWISPNFSTRIKKFWRKFYRINLRLMQF